MFDRMLIISTATVLTLQGVTDNGLPQPDLVSLTKRLESMIESPDMSLNALATELARHSAADDKQEARVTQLESLLQKMLSRNSRGCKALVSGLSKVTISIPA